MVQTPDNQPVALKNEPYYGLPLRLTPSPDPFALPVVFVNLLRDIIKTISLANREIQPLCNAFLLKVFLPLPIWVSRSKIATLMKNLAPVTTNEKFVQYYC
jgi:hypothetical protein